ncbi:hypothetical protein [Mycolicibacterium komossense]|uniref:Peptidase M41 domain-containing protein n=1 Tax=Mycolicibacterium komossense TaxID=1779 RepID=A0ABT3C4R8_9MYCO|nr:hypothetical protein [Mycolicibacterium komossense]MCV7224449.1 hypothetical protein [Mycolicibacterium komossense]
MDEDYPERRHTAYHEAGHAIAAIKTPRGAVEHIDICDRNNNDAESGGTNCSSVTADDAFRVYGGPWAHVKFYRPADALTFYDVLTCIYANNDDQDLFIHYAERDAEIFTAETFEDWHERADGVMSAAWEAQEVQNLAEEMLARAKKIRLSNGQLLIRDSWRDRWVCKDFVPAPEEGKGLVGPLPPFNH